MLVLRGGEVGSGVGSGCAKSGDCAKMYGGYAKMYDGYTNTLLEINTF